MSKYSMNFRLPSVRVDVAFIAKIESYLREKLPALFHTENARGDYSLTFVDSNGEERFGSIHDYPHERFGSDLVAVKISKSIGSQICQVSISLGVDKVRNRVRLEIDDTNSKVIANGIKNELESYFRSNRNNNWIFHSPISDWAGWAIFISGFGTMVVWADSYGLISTYCWTTVFALSAVYWLLKKHFPYVHFDSHRTALTEANLSWIIRIGVPVTLTVLAAMFTDLSRFFLGGDS